MFIVRLSVPGFITNIFAGRGTSFLEVHDSSQTSTRYYAAGRNCCGELGIGEMSETVPSPKEITTLKGLDVSYHVFSLFVSTFFSVIFTDS